MSRRVHAIYPNYGPPHLLGPEHPYPHGLKCWCGPMLATICQQCIDEKNPNCWACGGSGLVEVRFDDGAVPLLIIHNDEEEVRGRSQSRA